MDVHFAPPDLSSLDQLKTEALCLPLSSDERPLRGAPGLVDWRLCGRVSELLVSERMRGDVGEAVIMAARPRLPAERLVWLGVGALAQLDEARFRGFVRDLMQRLGLLRVRSAALVLPGRSRGSLDPARAMDWFLQESAPFGECLDEVTVLDTHDARREMQPLVELARRRALADV